MKNDPIPPLAHLCHFGVLDFGQCAGPGVAQHTPAQMSEMDRDGPGDVPDRKSEAMTTWGLSMKDLCKKRFNMV